MHKNTQSPYGTLYILPSLFHTAESKHRGSYCKKNVNNPQKVMTKKKIYGRI